RISQKNQDQNQNQNCPAATIPPTLSKLNTILKSLEFKQYLQEITNLVLQEHSSEIRLFKKGDYTMLHDHALERDGLDVTFSIPFVDGDDPKADWDPSMKAGGTHYVNDKTNLLTLYPKHNTLTVVLRDEGTLRFVRYLTGRV